MSKWYAKNDYLTKEEMMWNAKNITVLLAMAGMSGEAIAAVLGNMQAESGVNPGIWENLDPFNGGYGLVQWTPYTKYSDWWGTGWENNGDAEIKRIIYEMMNGLQWKETIEYPMSFKDFWISKLDSRYLAQVFVKNYERPKDPDQDFRSDYAEKWYNNVTKGAINLWYIYSRKEVWYRHGRERTEQ